MSRARYPESTRYRRHSPHTRQRVQPRYAPSASTKSESSGKSTQRKEKPSFFFQLAAFLDGTDRRLFESVLKGAEGRSTDDATDTGPPRDYTDSATGKHYRSDSSMPREPADNSTGRGSRLLRDYKILGEIGKGCNGDVRKAEVLPTARAKGGRCHFRAIKAMYQPVDNEVKERLEAAKGVLRSLNDCPNIIYFYTCFTETTTTGTEHLLFVNEYAEGGNLSARIKKNDSLHEKDPLHEQDKKAIIYGTLKGLSYLYEVGIVHRNITPNNILISSRPGRPIEWRGVKISDLMFCKGVEHGVAMRVAEPQGPTTFMAPEVFKRKIIYFSQDIWAFGVITYEMYNGENSLLWPSSSSMSDQEEYAKILWRSSITWTTRGWKSIYNKSAVRLCQSMLNPDFETRAKASSLIEDPWFGEFCDRGLSTRRVFVLE